MCSRHQAEFPCVAAAFVARHPRQPGLRGLTIVVIQAGLAGVS